MKHFKKLEPEFPTFNSKNINSQDDQPSNYHYNTNKMSSGSLNKYNKSPYLQSRTLFKFRSRTRIYSAQKRIC